MRLRGIRLPPQDGILRQQSRLANINLRNALDMPGDCATGASRNVVETSVLVLAKNEEHNVPKCLDAIFSQRVKSDFEVVFIDSGSSDRTVEIAKQYSVQLHQIPPEQFHHSRTRNLAATLSRGKFLVYLAADAFPAT